MTSSRHHQQDCRERRSALPTRHHHQPGGRFLGVLEPGSASRHVAAIDALRRSGTAKWRRAVDAAVVPQCASAAGRQRATAVVDDPRPASTEDRRHVVVAVVDALWHRTYAESRRRVVAVAVVVSA